jgi:hypothetical protein
VENLDVAQIHVGSCVKPGPGFTTACRPNLVIPAKAGISSRRVTALRPPDPGLRRGDGVSRSSSRASWHSCQRPLCRMADATGLRAMARPRICLTGLRPNRALRENGPLAESRRSLEQPTGSTTKELKMPDCLARFAPGPAWRDGR